MHHAPVLPRPRRRGIALMEALIAVLLLSLSALAFAALQMKGVSANSSSMWRSKATLLAYDMADRMRANREAVVANQYNSLTTPQSITDCGVTADCAAARMALLDYDQWSTALNRELPGGSGVVCLDATPDDGTAAAPGCDAAGTMLAVKVFWSERGQPSRLAVAVRP
jgi:type IV pilus assembly protein PilV